MIKFLGCKEIINEESVLYTRKRCVPHPACKVAIEKSLSSTQIAYRQQDNCTNTFIIYSTNTNVSTETHVPTPRYGHYLTRANYHITRAKAAMDGYFAVIRAHQHGIAVESMNGRTRFFFYFEGTVRSEVQSHVTRLTRADTNARPPYCTTPNFTLQFNIPQDGCTKVAGVISPATPYKST